MADLIKVVEFFKKEEFIPVDDWMPTEQDKIFRHTKGALILPISSVMGGQDMNLDYFVLSIKKRCYNSPKTREHLVLYLNYFEKFYDTDKELFMTLGRVKYLIDYQKYSSKEAFFHDLFSYILSPSIRHKVRRMNIDNYKLDLDSAAKRAKENLKYTDQHGLMLMEFSILMNICIPVLTHYIYQNKIMTVKSFLLEAYDRLMSTFEVDIYSKLYETVISSTENNKKQHSILWDKQDIRGINVTTHAIDSVTNLILNVVPKYVYNDNLVLLNIGSINRNIGYQVTDIGYELDFIPLSSSKRDEDNNSEFDKFESYLTKQDEALYIQNKVNASETMKKIINIFGPFEQEEIDLYIKELSSDNNRFIVNAFQKELVFNLFYKYFGDVTSIRGINRDEYVILVIAAKRILESNRMVYLPYIIGGKVNRIVPRTKLNKDELNKLINSSFYQNIVNKYRNPKLESKLQALMATVLSSSFDVIDMNKEIMVNR